MGDKGIYPKRKHSFWFRLSVFLLGSVVLLLALVITFCVWDEHRSANAWESFSEEMQSMGYPMDVDLLFPAPPPEEENFAAIPFFKHLITSQDFFVDAWQVASTLIHPHEVYIPRDLPERFWRHGYGWTPEDVRLILLTRGAIEHPEPAVNPQGNLQLFRYFDSHFNELKSALDRTFCQFSVFFDLGPQYPYHHLETLHEVVVLLSARAVTYLHSGRSAGARKDIIFVWELIHKLDTDRTITASLISESCFIYSIQPLWQGIAAHQWSGPQLAKLQSELNRFDFIESFKKNFLFETLWIANLHATLEVAWMESFISGVMKVGSPVLQKQVLKTEFVLEKLLSKIPMGWIRMNLIHLSKCAFAYADAVYKTEKHLIDPIEVKRKILDIDTTYGDTINPDRFVVANFKDSLFSLEIPRIAAQGQAYVDMGKIACALESLYLTEKKYPNSLSEDSLQPQSESFPSDVTMGEESYVYQKTSRSFLLYSLAWDKLNNLGQIGETSSGMEDWVWPAADLPVPGDAFFDRKYFSNPLYDHSQ